MKFLELKIPPVLIFASFMALMWITCLVTPEVGINEKLRFALGIALIVPGIFIAIVGVFGFKKAKTTFNPIKPDQASSLVCIGIYRYTRNPMYLGLLFGLLSWACYLDNFFSLLIGIGFCMYMTRFQIKPEEKTLVSIFGKKYQLYKKQVRRWL
jgi:protein-S-isoprenylcysteine O-methyltransferase Ste14